VPVKKHTTRLLFLYDDAPLFTIDVQEYAGVDMTDPFYDWESLFHFSVDRSCRFWTATMDSSLFYVR
jgi:hypothetical protein